MTELPAVETPRPAVRLPGWASTGLAGALGLAAFAAGWLILAYLRQRGVFGYVDITDVPVYNDYANAMLAGQLPYRDFGFEYPPAAIPAILLPGLLAVPRGDVGAFINAFENLMLLCGMASVAFVAIGLRELGANRERIGLAIL